MSLGIRDMRGAPTTFCTLMVWDELRFDYVPVIDCTKGEDARDQYLRLHGPPLIYVESIRYDRVVIRP